jgi:hypothetical protein
MRLDLQEIGQGYFRLVARLIAFAFPEHRWYRTLFKVGRAQQHVVNLVLGFTRYRKHPRRPFILTWIMESGVGYLIELGREFPIPMQHKNLEMILNARSDPNGLVLCSIHLPFIRLALLPLVAAGAPPSAVIADPEALIGGKLALWSTTKELIGLAADRDVLFKVRTILRHGGFVATLIDHYVNDPLNTNVFRLIRLTGARMLFAISELQPDGTILIEYLSPPDPSCLRDESIVANLLFLQSRTDRILHQLSSQKRVVNLTPKKTASQAKVATLEPDSSP